MIAKRSLKEKFAQTEKAAEKNAMFAKSLRAARKGNKPRATKTFEVTARFKLSSSVFYHWLSTTSGNPVTYKDEQGKVFAKLSYSGRGAALAVGGGVLWARGWMLHPGIVMRGAMKKSPASHVVNTSPTINEIIFLHDQRVIGVLVAGGINAQVGVMAGSGNFTKG